MTTTLITGETYEIKAELKALGGRWSGVNRGWQVPVENAVEAWELMGVDAAESREEAVSELRSHCGSFLSEDTLSAALELARHDHIWCELHEFPVRQRLVEVIERCSHLDSPDADGFGRMPKNVRKIIGEIRSAIMEAGIAADKAAAEAE